MVVLTTLFLIAAGVYALLNTPLDAIPDLSDVQVIVYTEYPGQAPRIVEDQVTYPLTTQMLAVPFSKVVRGYSFFGFSFVYVIFEDGTDMYWARSRVLEYLNYASGRLPSGVNPTLGPDATGVGWAFMYGAQVGPARPERAAFDPGLVSEIRADQCSGGFRSGQHWRFRSPIPNHGRPEQAPCLQHLHFQDCGRGEAKQQQRGRTACSKPRKRSS